MNFITWLIFSVFALFVTLLLEVLLAMSLYIFLNLQAPGLFASLVGWSRDMLNMLLDFLQGAAPRLAAQGDVSLFGELGPKAFLLLVLGLFASGVIRFFAWMVRRMARSEDY